MTVTNHSKKQKETIMTREKQYYEYKGRTYVLDGSYISDGGYLMLRFYDEEKTIWMNVNVGPFEDLLLGKFKPQKN